MNELATSFGQWLGRWLSQTTYMQGTAPPSPRESLAATLRPCDVLLVEGQTRVSVTIKYLTQSTWSHAALYVGDYGKPGTPHCFIEADIVDGVRLVGLEQFDGLHCRICRPVGLAETDRKRIIEFALVQVGRHYDLRNVIDLLRYLIPTPPVPLRWRRRMLALGSGDPTRAICSTLVAQCFQAVRYPILPIIETQPAGRVDCPDCVEEILRVRHHSLFVPRDFDVSPYFQVIKPTLEGGFDYRQLAWADEVAA
ncbi:MAG: lipo-like protein [Betaproteobacteria bacterium HGW-Betaproteobacteria-11]|nr:MAG: lipo-like protein [Betaproteobacteria bacterium HGW-Betaproteobacteria-11]